jgi:hypothetical protein
MVLEKGGASMQERIRYYITKSGEELTVRSVKVAKGSPRRDDVDPPIPDDVAEAKSPSTRSGSPSVGAVRRRENGAGPGRPTES